MRSAIALFFSALVAVAYFPEGGDSTPVLGELNNFRPSSALNSIDRKREGEILKRKNEEADRLLAQIEREKDKVRSDLENLNGKPNAGLHSPQYPLSSKDGKQNLQYGVPLNGLASGAGAHGIPNEYGAVKFSVPPSGYHGSNGSPAPTGVNQHVVNNNHGFNMANAMGHAPFNANGLYAGVRYNIGYDSESSDSDSSGMKRSKRGKENKKLNVKIAKHYEDGKKVRSEVRKALKKHLESQVKAGIYNPIPQV